MLHVALEIMEYCAWNIAAWYRGHRPTGNVLDLDSPPELLPILHPGWIVGFVCGLLMANEDSLPIRLHITCHGMVSSEVPRLGCAAESAGLYCLPLFAGHRILFALLFVSFFFLLPHNSHHLLSSTFSQLLSTRNCSSSNLSLADRLTRFDPTRFRLRYRARLWVSLYGFFFFLIC